MLTQGKEDCGKQVVSSAVSQAYMHLQAYVAVNQRAYLGLISKILSFREVPNKERVNGHQFESKLGIEMQSFQCVTR